MFSFEEYLAGWVIYLIAFVGVLFPLWKIIGCLAWKPLEQLLRLVVACVLLTPAATEQGSVFLSPAWINVALDWFLFGADPQGVAQWHTGFQALLRSFALSLSVYLFIVFFIIRHHKQKKFKASLLR